MRLRKPLAVIAAGALAASLAACGGGSKGDTGKDDASFQAGGDAGSAKDPEATGPAKSVEGATAGGTVTVLLPSPDRGPATLDPTAGWTVTDNSILQDLVFRSLTTFRQDRETGQMVLVPDLATDLGRPNDDFTEWTFTLKDGIKYDNGKPVTAEDIAWGIKRSFDGNNGTEGGGIAGPGTEYSVAYFLGGDKYNGPYDKSTAGEDFEGVSVSGNDITIKMSRPFPDMDYYGAFAAMGPVPQGAVSKPPKYGNQPWATGPYKVESFTPEKQLTLVRNDQWDPATDPARNAYPDKWLFKFDEDASATDELLISDNAEAQTSVSTSLLAENYAKAKRALGDRLVQGSTPCTQFSAPNVDKVTDIRIRQAIGYAYPYEDAWSAAGYVVGVSQVPGNAMLPPGMVGRKEYGPVNGEQVVHDTEKAKKLLEEAGVEPNSYKLSWIYKAGDPQTKAVADQLARAYKEAGFVPNPLPYDGNPYDVWTAAPDDETAAGRLAKEINISGVLWCADWPSGLTFLPPLLRTGATYNASHFSDKEVDARMDEIPSMPIDEQPAAWADLDKEVSTKHYPMINVGYVNQLSTYGSRIGGFAHDAQIGAPDYRGIFVKQ